MTTTLDSPKPSIRRRPGAARGGAPPNVVSVWPKIAWVIVIGFFLCFFVVPILWLLLAPTRTDHDIVVGAPLAFGSFSDLAATWDHVMEFQSGAIITWIGNSAWYSFAGMAIAVITCIPAGYALAMTKFRLRKALLTATLLVMLMPSATLVLPLYLEMDAFGLDGSAWSVILPFALYPFGTYLAYTYYAATVPDNLLDAARIDGANEWQAFVHIGLPLAKPVIALVAFLNFVHSWNQFFLPYVMLPSSGQYPAQVGLSNLLMTSPLFNSATGVSHILRPEIALAALVTSVPVLVVFLFAQRSLVEGMTAGATKG
ncbi:carbohydrate ABC transporter permease [Streptomyces sp. NPDC050704]|uniref:carbohydrate ABC transporter permease n=1 Tax=Streptomyces sp. NPDC050704 TaxID=3157219 RepID=UPI00344533E8